MNTATATVGGGVVDPNPADNSATDTDTVTPAANLGITKTDGATQVALGGTLSYTIVASNPGPSGVTGATVADTFPASCTSVSWACSGTGTCPANGTGAITALVDLPVGTQVTNESSGVTDDPAVMGAGNATAFGVAQIVPVPVLGIPGLLLLALGVYLIAATRRRALAASR